MYGLGVNFWLKLFFIIAIVVSLLLLFNAIMRKMLKVEKKKLFSYNHVNEKHKKIDWTIRFAFLVLFLFGNFINITSEPMGKYWFLQTPFLLFVFIFVTESIRAFMERKYAENRNDYIFTISQLVFVTILYISIITTEFYGWFS